MPRTYRAVMQRLVDRSQVRSPVPRAAPADPQAVQLALVLVTLGFCTWAVRNEWSKAGPRLKHAQPGDVALALAAVAAYYLVFILGWIRILDAWGIRIPYRVALQAEMVSMLAKYLPGRRLDAGRAHARAAALRERHRHADRARVDPRRGGALGDLGRDRLRRQPRVGARRRRAAPCADPLRASCSRRCSTRGSFGRLSRRVLKPFGADAIEPLPFPTTLALLLFYCGTWLIGGLGALLPAAQPRRVARPRRRSRSSAASPPSARSSPCSPSSRRPASARARRRCTACCSRSRARRRRSA